MLIEISKLGLSPYKGGGAMPYPAPAGYRWAFVIENGDPIVENGTRVVELQRTA